TQWNEPIIKTIPHAGISLTFVRPKSYGLDDGLAVGFPDADKQERESSLSVKSSCLETQPPNPSGLWLCRGPPPA
ncbi:MAG: hypothetical protein LBI87_07985, partial [Candidatus Accumulibacter sp.]|nr:hypothetical protein [Accumulibacter sp.]